MQMQSADFDSLFLVLIGHEGGYVNDPDDPGGETKFGVSKRTYPDEDIPNLSLDRAKFLYRRDFWNRYRFEQLPPQVRFDIFDFAVNSGQSTAIRHMQRVLGVAEDGIVGNITLAAMTQIDNDRFLRKYSGARLQYLCSLSKWSKYGKGWALRVAFNLQRD